MANFTLVERLAAKVMEVDPGADEEEISSAYRGMVNKYHPDISDEPNAEQWFIAAQNARDVLTGAIDQTDADKVDDAIRAFKNVLGESEVEEVREQVREHSDYVSEAQKRSDPGSFDLSDMGAMSREEREEMIQRVAMGIETVIVYQAVEGLFAHQFTRDDFFHAVNDYIEEEEPSRLTYDHYWEAVKEHVREEVHKRTFTNSIRQLQSNLQAEYGEGTTIREIARIIAYFVIQGGMDLGDVGRFVGGGKFSRDSRFSRGSSRFGTGNRRFGGGSRVGRDRRFD